jgi:PAS domain S-box-containing protein
MIQVSYMRARVAAAVGSVSGGGHKAKPLHASSPATHQSPQEATAAPATEPQLPASHAAEFRRLLHAFVDQSPAMSWISGPDSLFAFVNGPWLEFRGRTLEQERGTGWWEGVHPEDRDRCHTRYLSAFEGRQPFQFECRLQRANGSYAWFALNGVPQYLLNGQFLGYAGSARTIKRESQTPGVTLPSSPGDGCSVRRLLGELATSRQLATVPMSHPARAVKLSSETLLACLETSPTPHLVLDRAGKVVYANAALRTFAAKALGSYGQHPVDSDEQIRAWLNSPSIPDAFDVQFVWQPLPRRAEPVSCFAIIDAGAEHRGRSLQNSFLHDLLNAVSGLEMVGELLEESSLPKEPTEYVRLLQISIQQLSSAIYQQRVFLDDSGLMVSQCSARAVLEEVVAAQEGIALQRSCSIEITGNGAEIITVVTDKMLLVRVLESMLQNALEASSRGDVVTAGYQRIQGQVEFWVHNPSPPSLGARANPLQRPLQAKGHATVLGMQAVRLLNELHLKRSVAFSSSSKHGTTLSVRFPDASQLR